MNGPSYDRVMRRVFGPEGSASPRRLGKYLLLRQVGHGGMGVVYEAEDPELRRLVALKVVREEDVDPAAVARLHREASIAAQLHHPNIVPVHDVGVVRDPEGRATHFIAMDFVEGTTLADLLAEGKTPRATLLRWLEEIAGAVGYAHETGVIHRDLKPANVLMEKGGRPLLTDFGLAHAERYSSRLTLSNAVLGTPQYMAPEQAQGRTREISARTDVYALGVMLYEILTGRRPFRGQTPEKLFRQICHEEPQAPGRAVLGVDRDLEVICLKALEKDPRRRFESGEEFAEELARVRRGEPIRSRPPTLSYRLWRRLRKRGALIAVGAAALLSIVVGIGFGLAQLLKASRAETQAKEQQARQRDLELRILPLIERAREEVRSAQAMLYQESYPFEVWKEKLSEAERLCREAIREHAGCAPAYVVLGVIEMERGKIDAAIAAFTKAIERNPRYDQAYLERAKASFEKAIAFETRTYISFSRTLPMHDRQRFHLECSRRDLENVRAGVTPSEERILTDLMLRVGEHGIRGEVERGIARGDVDARAWRVAGEAEHRLLRYGGAVGCYRRYLGVFKGDARAWARLAHFLQDHGDLTASFEAATRAVRLNPELPQAYVARAEAQDNDEAALADCTRAIELEPLLLQAYTNRASLRMRRRDVAGAIADLSKAIEADPEVAPPYYFRTFVRWEQADYSGAAADLDRATRLDPWMKDRCAFLYGSGSDGESYLDWMIAEFTKRIEIQPSGSEAYVLRAQARFMKKDYGGVIADLTRAIELGENSFDVFRVRGKASFNMADWRNAVADLTKAVEFGETSAGVAEALGEALRKTGDRKGAIETLTRAIESGCDSTPLRKSRGLALYEAGDFQGAIEDLTKALEWGDKSVDLFRYRGKAFFETGDWDRAIADWQRVVEYEPKSAQAHFNLGCAYQAKGDSLADDGQSDPAIKEMDQAISHFSRAIELDPQDANPLNNRGNTYLKKGQALAKSGSREAAKAEWKRALEDHAKAIERDPRSPMSYSNRAAVRIELGDIPGAIEDYSKCIGLDPKDAKAHVYRARLRLQQGDRPGAAADARSALELPLSDEARREMEEILRSVGRQE